MTTAATTPDLLTPADAVQPPPATTNKTRRHLSRLENRRLMDWLEANKDTATQESDAALAALATDALGFIITKSHILATRAELGITKTKPVPAVTTPQDVDLVALHKQVQEQGGEIQKLKIECQRLSDVIPTLNDMVKSLQDRLSPPMA